MSKDWIIAQKHISPGEKVEAMLKVPGTAEEIPATLINGSKKGKTLIVISGLHGGEYDGIEAAIELGKEIKPEEIYGRLIMLHPLSLSIMLSGQSSLHPVDGKNLNRIFPPDSSGTVSDKIADYLLNELLLKADFCLDLHGGGHCMGLYPHGYITGVCAENVFEQAAKAAMVLDIPYFIRSSDKTGAYNYAGIKGVPGITVERGCLGMWDMQNVELFKKDIRNIMRFLGMLKDDYEPNRYISK